MNKSKSIPREFEDLLTAKGRRVLSGSAEICGALADPKRRFLVLNDLIAKRKAEAIRQVLEVELLPFLSEMNNPIPPETIWDMQHDYEESLPKTARVSTAYLDRKSEAAYLRAQQIGIVDLLKSESLAAFAEAIVGCKLDRKSGQQALCYKSNDYIGPHNDHHPENKRAAQGYLDVHLSLSSKEVEHQYLVYARAGHFTQMIPVQGLGCLTIYRLPFWHYTTPLQVKAGKEADARRWVLLATYLYAREKKRS